MMLAKGFALALIILLGVGAWLWLSLRPQWPRFTYEVTRSGIRVMILNRFRLFEVPKHKIDIVRIQDSPAGYTNAQAPLSVLRIVDDPMALTGISIVRADGSEVLLTPQDPHKFLRMVAACEIAVEAPSAIADSAANSDVSIV